MCGEVNVHLRVKEADGRLHDRGDLVRSLHLEDLPLVIHDHGRQLHAHVLRLHVQREAKGQLLGLAGGHVDGVLHSRQVAHDALPRRRILGLGLGREQGARDEGHVEGRGVVVGDGDEGLGGAVVDKLNAEDVGFRERGRHVGGDLGGAIGRGGAGVRALEKKRKSMGWRSSVREGELVPYLGECAEDLGGQHGQERGLEQHIGGREMRETEVLQLESAERRSDGRQLGI